MTTANIPAGLADYAAARGYTGGPWIAQTFGHTRHEPRGWTEHETTEILTVERVRELADAGWSKVCVHWDYGVAADFALSELLPLCGIRGNPASFPVPISVSTSKHPGDVGRDYENLHDWS